MSEFPKVCKFSSTQAISPQYLNVFTTNLIYKGFGIFVCTAVLKNIRLDLKLHTIYFVIFHCLSARRFVLLTVTLIFNKAQPVLYTRVVVQWDGTGF